MPNTSVLAAATGLPETQSDLSRRVLLVAIPAAAIGIGAPKPAAAATVDPIFSLIEQHKTALADWNENHCGAPTEVEAWDAMQAICDRLLATVPTTPAGVHAFLEYAARRVELDNDFEEFKLAVRSILASPALAGGANG